MKLNKEDITELSPGDIRYVDLRSISQHWYNNIEEYTPNLPNEHSMIYVVPFHMVEWVGKGHTKIATVCPLLQHSENWNHTMVKEWGMYKEPQKHHVLVDKDFLAKHPDVLNSLLARKSSTSSLKPKKPRRTPPVVPSKPDLVSAPRPRGRPRLVPTNVKPTLKPTVVGKEKIAHKADSQLLESRPALKPVTAPRRSSRVATRR